MGISDAFHLQKKILSTEVISAVYQSIGNRPRQEDAVVLNNDDIYIIADGMGGMPHGDIAGTLAAESALWTINLEKKRISYWKEKKLLGGRIMRSVNLSLYNQRKIPVYEQGMGSTLSVLLLGEKQFYIYNIGDSRVYHIRENKCQLLTPLDRDTKKYLTKALGVQKKVPDTFFYTDKLLSDDVFLLVTDGVGDYVSEEQYIEIIATVFTTRDSAEKTVKEIVTLAQKQGSSDNMSACIVKYISTK